MIKQFFNWWNNLCIHNWQYSMPFFSSPQRPYKTVFPKNPKRFRGCTKCDISQKYDENKKEFITMPRVKWSKGEKYEEN